MIWAPCEAPRGKAAHVVLTWVRTSTLCHRDARNAAGRNGQGPLKSMVLLGSHNNLGTRKVLFGRSVLRKVFTFIPKKGNAKECSNYHTIALISHASKVMLKILQARLQQYVNHELSDVQAGFRNGRGTRDQIANIRWITKKAREFQKNFYFCFLDYAKAFDCVDHNKLWKILKEMGIPDHLTFLLRNLYAGQEATVRTGHGTTDWFQTGKGVHQGCILSPSYLTSMQSTS